MDTMSLSDEDALKLDKALSLIQQVRTEESGPLITELEDLINQIHVISGEYRS